MKHLIPLLLAVQSLSGLAYSADFPAHVVGISDGDTITVLKGDKARVKIRLHGIDAPETGQDFGSRAKQFASDLAFGKDVTIKHRDTDRYGRTVAEVILPDGRSLNRELVRGGMAWWYRAYAPDDKELEGLEAEAKAAKRGLWSQAGAIPPWEWRHPKASESGELVGNLRSRVYHKGNCSSVVRMKPANRVTFKTAAEAEAAGYRKAGDCR